MGLDITVGVLIECLNDPGEDGKARFADYQADLARVNQTLRYESYAEHDEPIQKRGGAPWSRRMWGYAGLHYLRRVAAHLWAGNDLPSPGNNQAASKAGDPVLDECYSMLYQRNPNSFPHLIFHSDSNGYYLPLDFKTVIYQDPDMPRFRGGMIGSVPRLLDECTRLVQALEIPPDLEPDAPQVSDAAAHQGEGDAHWQRYGIESFTCLHLLHACQISLESGCAIVFH